MTNKESQLALERWRGQVDEKLESISGSVGEVKASLATLGHELTSTIRDADRCGKREHEGFDARLRQLEEVRAKLYALACIAGVLGGGLAQVAFSALAGHLFRF